VPFNSETLLLVLIYILIPFTMSSLCTLAIREISKKWNVLDVPNERSSHSNPSPTLGGLGVIIGVLSGGVGGYLFGSVGPGRILIAPLLLLIVLLLPVISDEIKPWGVRRKLLLQLLIATALVIWGIHLDWISLPYWGRVDIGIWGKPLSIAWLILMCNVFNFMDGIDGIVGCQSLVVCGLLALVGWSVSSEFSAAALVLLVSVGGFLMYNMPPASIFLGDIGSWFLGLFIGVLGLWGEHLGVPLWFFCIALGFFLFDVFYTLLRRLAAGENVIKAHKKHLYQRLHSIGWSFLKIDLLYMAIALLLGLGAWGLIGGNYIVALGLLAIGGVAVILVTVQVERHAPVFG
jgi:UDP-N-acetylmuramyl pentapeptide phosphotransferase/UDP-N-acetylglucosamine-1-phosphate transferase